VVQRAVSSTDFQQGSIQQRFLIWLSSLEAIKKRPFLGSGIGTYGVVYPAAQGKVLSQENYKKYIPQANKSINAHNEYLQIASELGIVGLLAFLWIIWAFYSKLSNLEKKIGEEDKFYLIAFVASSVAILTHSIVSFPFRVIQNGLLFWLMLALTDVMIRQKGFAEIKEKVEEEGKPKYVIKESKLRVVFKRSLQIFIILGAVFLASLIYKVFLADTHIQRGRLLAMAKRYPQARMELERAAQINPHDGRIYRYLGEVYSRLSEYEMAISAFRKAEISWVYPLLYNNLGFAYQALWKLDEAEKAFKKNIYLFPNRAEAYYNLGNVYVRQAESYLKLNNLQLAKNKLDEAVFYYEQAKVFDSNFTVPIKVSELYSELGSRIIENNDKNGEKSIIVSSFFPGKKSFFLDLLKPIGEAGKPICINLFYYHSQGINKDLEAKVEIKNKERKIVKVLKPSHRRMLSDNVIILSGLWQPEASREEYYAIAKIKDAGREILSKKREFYIKKKGEPTGKITEFEVNKKKGSSEIMVNFVFKNQGAIPLQIMGEIQIRDTQEKLIAEKQLGFKNVSPHTSEEIKLTLEKDLIPGVYKAIAIIIYGGNKVVKAEQFFLISE